MKKHISMIGIFIILLILVLGVVTFLENDKRSKDNMNNKSDNRNLSEVSVGEISKDVQPIYNHFPSLPKSEKMEWISSVENGVGLSKIDLYTFVFYNKSTVKELFKEYELLESQSDLELFFVPEELKDIPLSWKQLKEYNCFQKGIKETDKVNTDAYIDVDNGILYFHAVTD